MFAAAGNAVSFTPTTPAAPDIPPADAPAEEFTAGNQQGAPDDANAALEARLAEAVEATKEAEEAQKEARSRAKAAREAAKHRKAAAAATRRKATLAEKLHRAQRTREELKLSVDPRSQKLLADLQAQEKQLRAQLKEAMAAEEEATLAAREAAEEETVAHLAENSAGAWAAHADAHTLHRQRLMDAALAAAAAANAAIVNTLALPATEEEPEPEPVEQLVPTPGQGAGADIVLDTEYADYGLPEPMPPRIRLRN